MFPRMTGHDLIVIGSSAGGIEALSTLVGGLPKDLGACILVVQHLPATRTSVLDRILGAAGDLPVRFAADGDPIKHGMLYLAPSDRHLIVADGHVKIVIGPRENNFRPAVDPLFRSAAWRYGPRTIGIVLSGALDCGTAGLIAIKRRGGLAVIQDPADAMVSDMPRSVLENVQVDHSVPIAGMAELLLRLVREPVRHKAAPASPLLEQEVRIDEMAPDVELHSPVGTPAALTCPECAGPLCEIGEGPQLRFRCRVGHAFGGKTLSAEHVTTTEGAFWAALRALEEQASLARRLASRARELGQTRSVKMFETRAETAEHQARIVREQLLKNLADPSAFADDDPVDPSAGR